MAQDYLDLPEIGISYHRQHPRNFMQEVKSVELTQDTYFLNLGSHIISK